MTKGRYDKALVFEHCGFFSGPWRRRRFCVIHAFLLCRRMVRLTLRAFPSSRTSTLLAL